MTRIEIAVGLHLPMAALDERSVLIVLTVEHAVGI
jgi:hypothetical protein